MAQPSGKITISEAQSDEDREAIYRFRYRVYVEEMDRYRAIADHAGKRLVEPDDATSHLFQATLDGSVIGTMRLSWGGDGGLNDRHIGQYDLEPFLGSVPPEQIIVGERFMIEPDYRGSDLLFKLFTAYLHFVNERRIQLMFGDCEPHLLNVYQGLGFRTYTRKNVNSSETGYLVPLVLVPEDVSYLQEIHSPISKVVKDFGTDTRIPDGLELLLAGGEAVLSQRLISMTDYWVSLSTQLTHFEDNRAAIFDGMNDEDIQLCLAKSNVIECAPGDRVIKKGNVAKNMYVVVSGTLEVRGDNEIKALLSAGDMFGDIAFFLGLPRTLDVVAATGDVKIISLSETTLRSLMDNHPHAAAKLLQNVAKMLCFRLVSTH